MRPKWKFSVLLTKHQHFLTILNLRPLKTAAENCCRHDHITGAYINKCRSLTTLNSNVSGSIVATMFYRTTKRHQKRFLSVRVIVIGKKSATRRRKSKLGKSDKLRPNPGWRCRRRDAQLFDAAGRLATMPLMLRTVTRISQFPCARNFFFRTDCSI